MTPSGEPVAIGAALIAAVQALLAVLLGFGVVDWTSAQVGLLQGLLVAVVGLVAVVVRGRVTPVNV